MKLFGYLDDIIVKWLHLFDFAGDYNSLVALFSAVIIIYIDIWLLVKIIPPD